MTDTFVNLGLYLSYLLIIVGTLAAIVFPILYLIKDPKSAKSAFIGLGFVFGVLLVSYLFADGTILPDSGTVTFPLNHDVTYNLVVTDGICFGDTSISLSVDSSVLVNAGNDTAICFATNYIIKNNSTNTIYQLN